MKTLKDYIVKYIYEDFEQVHLSELTAVYNAPSELHIHLPEDMDEDAFVIYLNDTVLDKLPNNADLAKKFFGINADNILDAYFEYDELLENPEYDGEIDLEYNPSGDDKDGKPELKTFLLRGLHYTLKFDTFDLECENDDEKIKEALIKIFVATESNSTNKYPIEFIFDKSKLEYA